MLRTHPLRPNHSASIRFSGNAAGGRFCIYFLVKYWGFYFCVSLCCVGFVSVFVFGFDETIKHNSLALDKISEPQYVNVLRLFCFHLLIKKKIKVFRYTHWLYASYNVYRLFHFFCVEISWIIQLSVNISNELQDKKTTMYTYHTQSFVLFYNWDEKK